MEQREAWIILNHLSYLKTSQMRELLDCFAADPLALLHEKDSLLKAKGFGWFVRKKAEVDFDLVLKETEKNLKLLKASFVCIGDDNYPELLKEIYDPPLVLFYKGQLKNTNQKKVAVVGSRLALEHSLKFAASLASDLSNNGVEVVSGMARGIDSAAHKGALKGHASTYAVLGCGLNIIYPKENKKLFEQIAEQGAVISELDFNAPPLAVHFPVRNRIVSGMSDASVIVEGKKRSGSLITARLCIENNREIFAVPGRPMDKNSAGTNELIKNGAFPLTEANDIFEYFGINPLKENKSKSLDHLDSDERVVYDIIDKHGSVSSESILGFSDLNSGCLPVVLLKMELKGILKKTNANTWALL